jgi:hypothetical protein
MISWWSMANPLHSAPSASWRSEFEGQPLLALRDVNVAHPDDVAGLQATRKGQQGLVACAKDARTGLAPSMAVPLALVIVL